MRRMVEKLLAQYGMDMTVGGKHVRALLQPVTDSISAAIITMTRAMDRIFFLISVSSFGSSRYSSASGQLHSYSPGRQYRSMYYTAM